MQVQSMHFKERAGQKLADVRLQKNLKKLADKFVTARAAAIAELDDFEGTREAAVERRKRALENLDVWLEPSSAMRARAARTCCTRRRPKKQRACPRDRGDARRAQDHQVEVDGVARRSALEHAIEAAGSTPVETDLGEYILQINNNEPPSHIIGPALHKDKEEVAELFRDQHAQPRKTEIDAAVPRGARRAARALPDRRHGHHRRQLLRRRDRLGRSSSPTKATDAWPRRCRQVHVAISGIEKIVPTLEDVATLMRLLPRSATGQSISNYVYILTGPAGRRVPRSRAHVLHRRRRGRTGCSAARQEALRCIRCGACMNHCPVYQNVGGHAYGWVYPGPIGSILTPMYVGLENALDLPQASTLCNQCGVVCPVKIPLPDLLRKLREKQFERRLRPWVRSVWG